MSHEALNRLYRLYNILTSVSRLASIAIRKPCSRATLASVMAVCVLPPVASLELVGLLIVTFAVVWDADTSPFLLLLCWLTTTFMVNRSNYSISVVGHEQVVARNVLDHENQNQIYVKWKCQVIWSFWK